MVIVDQETIYVKSSGKPHAGFYLDETLKSNIDHFFIKAVEKKWDCVLLITGIEGSGKSTAAQAIAKYMDRTFPGKLLNNGTPQRACTRIVFTPKQFSDAIDAGQVGEAILFDEAVTAMMAQDSGAEIQKILIKKMTMIRKKRLYILILIPYIFMLRRYFAVVRTRALIHFYTPDGIERGYFKFYNYDNKRLLYFRGFKEWNMQAYPPNFKGRTVDTTNYFINPEEYEAKKDAATIEMTTEPERKKKEESGQRKRIRETRDKLLFYVYHVAENMEKAPKKFTMEDFHKWLKPNTTVDLELKALQGAYASGRRLVVGNSTIGNQEESGTEYSDM